MELTLIHQKTYEIRGQKVMFDFDLARLYEVETRVLKQSVKRNIERFPSDFMFELTETEIELMKLSEKGSFSFMQQFSKFENQT